MRTVQVELRSTEFGTVVGVRLDPRATPVWLHAESARVLADELVSAAADAERQDEGAW